MRTIVDKLQEHKFIFKSFKPILPKELGSRKKIDIYLGVDTKNYYAIILYIAKKSRILRKEAGELMHFHEKLEAFNESAIKKKYIYIQAPLCSKAKALFEEKGWLVLLD